LSLPVRVSNSRHGVIGTSDDAFGELAAEAVSSPPLTRNRAVTAPHAAQRDRPTKRRPILSPSHLPPHCPHAQQLEVATINPLAITTCRFSTPLRMPLWSAGTTADGVPVKGYFEWSAQDNLEWIRGFGNRYGIVYVDFATQKRTPKISATFFREVARQNALV
jgi:hypothetical protein